MPEDISEPIVPDGSDNDAAPSTDPPVETVPETPAAAAPTSDIDDEVLGIAATLGLPREAAMGFQTKGALVDYLNRLTATPQSQPAPARAPQPAAAPTGATPAEKAAFKRFDHADFDEQFLSDLNGQLEVLHGGMGAGTSSNDAVQALQQQLQQITHHLVVSAMDGLIGQHGESYADVLGKGPTSAFARGSSEHTARVEKLLPRMQALQRSFEQMNLPAQSEEALFKAAVGLEFGNRAATQAREEVAKQVKDRESQGIRRPAGQGNASPDPQKELKERAAAARQRILEASTLTEDELRARAASFSS